MSYIVYNEEWYGMHRINGVYIRVVCIGETRPGSDSAHTVVFDV